MTFTDNNENALYRKVALRLLPVLFLFIWPRTSTALMSGLLSCTCSTILNSAKLFTVLVPGFFIGYFLFEIPSNLALHKVGARLWIARIMITWALLSAAMAWVTTPMSFYVLRFY